MDISYKLLPSQQDYLKHRDEPVWAFPAAIGSGKTFVTMLDLCMRVAQNGERWLVGSQTWSTTQTVQFKQIQAFLDEWKVPYHLDKARLILTLKNGGEIRGCCSSSENSVTGATLYHGALFDEAFLWKNEARLYIEGRCRGVDKDGTLIRPKYRYVGSPPLIPAGWYYDFCYRHPDKCTHSSMWEAEGKTLSKEYIEQQISSYGGAESALCRIQVFGEMPTGDSAGSIFRREHHTKRIPVSMGIDCSGGDNGDAAYFIVSDGIDILEECSMEKFTQKELLSKAVVLGEKWNISECRIDTTGGYGTALKESLEDTWRSRQILVEGINFAQAAYESKSYSNARAEMYFNAATVWNDDWEVFKAERFATVAIMSNSGKLQIIGKEKIKELLGYSPDGLDALCLALYSRSSVIHELPVDEGRVETALQFFSF